MRRAPAGPRIARFAGSERALHWLLAVTFFVMLASGIALFVPDLAIVVARPRAQAWHINAAVALAGGVVALFAAHWSRLRATMRDLDRFDRDDARWLFGLSRHWRGAPAPPQGRFNAGQKLNSAIVAGLMVVLFITGTLLWLGERDTRYRFAGTVIVHDWATWILVVLVIGHLYMAMVNRTTRPALRGIVVGDVDREWARRHHGKWVEGEARAGEHRDRGVAAKAPVAAAEQAEAEAGASRDDDLLVDAPVTEPGADGGAPLRDGRRAPR